MGNHTSVFTQPRRFASPLWNNGTADVLWLSTQAAFANRVPTAVEPVTDATRFVLPNSGNKGFMHFIGTDAANETMDVRVIGWTPVMFGARSVPIWIPKIQWAGTATLGAMTGEADHPFIDDSILFADTVTASATATEIVGDTTVVSPANDTDTATVIFDRFGAAKIEIQVNVGTPTAASGGVLLAGF